MQSLILLYKLWHKAISLSHPSTYDQAEHIQIAFYEYRRHSILTCQYCCQMNNLMIHFHHIFPEKLFHICQGNIFWRPQISQGFKFCNNKILKTTQERFLTSLKGESFLAESINCIVSEANFAMTFWNAGGIKTAF